MVVPVSASLVRGERFAGEGLAAGGAQGDALDELAILGPLDLADEEGTDAIDTQAALGDFVQLIAHRTQGAFHQGGGALVADALEGLGVLGLDALDQGRGVELVQLEILGRGGLLGFCCWLRGVGHGCSCECFAGEG